MIRKLSQLMLVTILIGLTWSEAICYYRYLLVTMTMEQYVVDLFLSIYIMYVKSTNNCNKFKGTT